GPRKTTSPTAYNRADIVDHAKELLGLKYKYGVNNPRQGFDCSGLVLYLYQNAGIDIERVSRDQAKQGTRIPLKNARPGDLVFYKRGTGGVFHVSVIVEAGVNKLVVIHATNSGVIREDVLESRYWEPKIYQIRDILN
ncbi:MAG: C40 family peptidase, partial [Bacteroidota bacterium]